MGSIHSPEDHELQATLVSHPCCPNSSLWLIVVVIDQSSFLAHHSLVLRIGLVYKLLIGFMKDITEETIW